MKQQANKNKRKNKQDESGPSKGKKTVGGRPSAVKGGFKVDQATPGSPGVNFVVTELSVEGVTI